jgi:hypothetical protein
MGIIKVSYIPTDENTADIFTKPLTPNKFHQHRRKIMHPNFSDQGGVLE